MSAALALAVALGSSGTLAQQPLTMEQAVLIAERNAFAVRLQQTTVERDRQAIALALSALGPTLGLNTLFTQNGEAIYESFGPGTSPILISPFNTTVGTASINLPIDIAGNLNRLVGASQAAYQAAQQSLEGSFNDARLNARTAYLTVLRNQALVGVAQASLQDAKGRFDQAELEFKQVQIAKIDVDRFDAQVAQANSDLLNAQNNLELSKHAFNLALARPIETPISLVDIDQLPALPSDTDAVALKAEQDRPEARALVDQIRSLALIRRAQEAGLNPSLALGLAYQRNLDTSAFQSSASTTTMTLSLSVPVFDSGATRARVREARQDETTAKIQLQQEQLTISQEVRDAVANLLSAQARLTNADRQVKLAEEVFRLARVRQEAGEGTYVEVIDAESSLAQARNGFVSARYDYFQAYSQLQHGAGKDRLDQLTSGAPATAPGDKK